MKVVSFFSGLGGLDKGFVDTGYDIIWANDFDKYAVQTYKANFGEHIVLGDINEIPLEEIPDCDILIGSPVERTIECQRSCSFGKDQCRNGIRTRKVSSRTDHRQVGIRNSRIRTV